MLQPLDFDALLAMTRHIKHLISLEEHFENSGLGSILAQQLIKKEPPWKLHSMGIPYRFIHDINTTEGLRKKFGISADDIVNKIIELKQRV